MSLKRDNEEKDSSDRVAINTAKALLGEDEGMNSVHSTKSVVALLKAAKEKINNISETVKLPSITSAEPKVFNEPKIVVHEPNEGTRLEAKNNVNNLPYMHRNPAV